MELTNCILSRDQWTALWYCFEWHKEEVESIVLDNNGLIDESLTRLLNGIHNNLNPVSNISISKSEFGLSSCRILYEIIDTRLKFDQLIIDNWKIIGTALCDFFKLLTDNCNIKRLSLTGLKLNKRAVDLFIDLLESPHYITEIDLSNTHILPNKLEEIEKIIKSNNMKLHRTQTNDISM